MLNFPKTTVIAGTPETHFVVIHPLDDAPEHKVDTARLGVMPLTTSVKASLMVLRGYLILMMLLVLYHVIDISRAGGHSR